MKDMSATLSSDSQYAVEDYDGCFYYFSGDLDTGEGSFSSTCGDCSYVRRGRKRLFLRSVVHRYRLRWHRVDGGAVHQVLQLDDGQVDLLVPVPQKLLVCVGSAGPILRALKQFPDDLKDKAFSVGRPYFENRVDWCGSVSELLRYDFDSVDLIDGKLWFRGRSSTGEYRSYVDDMCQKNDEILHRYGFCFDDGPDKTSVLDVLERRRETWNSSQVRSRERRKERAQGV